MKPASQVAPPWSARSIRAGGWTITALFDGTMRLDAGAMWGVVPKALWGRMTPVGEDNTLLLALRPFLCVRDDLVVVVEPGIGGRWSAKERRIYAIDGQPDLVATLAACGHAPGDVTHVVASHCHWDHIGAGVIEGEDGALRPLFPNARHWMPAVEVQAALEPDPARAASYRAEDVAVVRAAGLLETYAQTTELLPGLRARVLGGHSDGVSLLTFGEDEPGETAVFWSDVVPTAHHIQPAYIMAFDIDVVRSLRERSAWLERAAEGGWIGMFFHDIDRAFGRVRRDGKRYLFEPA